ncbi:MAG: hypothetical protein HY421_01580 [Candidatus Kerfeldbacteria bacterium]|nr:hypothetical protein [Candidatus Kerfeldbacteria bacterium]
MSMPDEQPKQPSKLESSPVQRLLDAIGQGHVQMRPKWKFIMENVAVGAAIVAVAIGLVYLGSFITYLWRSARFSALPAFGPEGYGLLVRAFPWWQVLFILLAAGAFIFLLRRKTHLYRWPLLVTLGVFVLAFVMAAAVTDAARLHDRLANRSLRGGGVPIVGPFYRGHHLLVRGLVTPGAIMKINGSTWTIDTDDETVKVKITDQTRIPANWEPAVSDEIVVVGERDDGAIEATAILPADRLPRRMPFRVPRPDEIPRPPPSYY